MKRILSLMAFVILLVAAVSAQNTSATKMKSFIDGLMAKMTLEEKIGQLNLLTGAPYCK